MFVAGTAGMHGGQGGRGGDAYIGGPAATVGIALNATAATGSMHLMLARLPKCFTIGEPPRRTPRLHAPILTADPELRAVRKLARKEHRLM